MKKRDFSDAICSFLFSPFFLVRLSCPFRSLVGLIERSLAFFSCGWLEGAVRNPTQCTWSVSGEDLVMKMTLNLFWRIASPFYYIRLIIYEVPPAPFQPLFV